MSTEYSPAANAGQATSCACTNIFTYNKLCVRINMCSQEPRDVSRLGARDVLPGISGGWAGAVCLHGQKTMQRSLPVYEQRLGCRF